MRRPPQRPQRAEPVPPLLEIYAFLGEDENGSGEIGIKQGLVPAGYVPLVALLESKVGKEYIKTMMSLQAAQYGKKIHLCRFVFDSIVWATEEGEAPPEGWTGERIYDTLPMSNSQMAERSKKRPANYEQLSEEERWDVDKNLGILDWNGEP